VHTLPPLLDEANPLAQAWRHLDTLRELGIDPDDLTALMQGPSGVDIRPRTYRTKTYDECFVGSAALAWFERTFFLKPADALRAGQALLELGYLYHVVREQPFKAGHFFYRVRANTPRLNALDLCEVAARMRSGGVAIRDRTFRRTTYPGCFVGSEAVTWMRRSLALSENEAMTLGERLLELCIFHHVFDEQHFRNGHFFFRFYRDES
jgi:hypothetical protein